MGTPPPRTREHSDYTKLNLHSLETWDGWRQLHKQKTRHVILGFVFVAGFVPSIFTQKYSSALSWSLSGHRHVDSPFTNNNKQKHFGLSPNSVPLPYILALFMILSDSTQNGRTRGCIFMPAVLTTLSTDTDSWTQNDIVHWCRRLDTKWPQSRLCFHNFQTLTLTNSIRNGVKTCCTSIFHSISPKRVCGVSLLQVLFNSH